jgi:hypothetical protein
MELVLVIGIICVAFFFGLCAFIEGIVEHIIDKDDKKHTPKTTIIEKTPEQLYEKCCYCPHYATCTKTFEEVTKC